MRGEARLDLLHKVIQLAMGWSDSHLHLFLVGADCYSDPRFDEGLGFPGDAKDKDERQVPLSALADAHYRTIGYQYDFGDSWDHIISIEEELAPVSGDLVAVCLGGEGACPPEDCGGLPGFEELLRAMKRPKGGEYRQFVRWLGKPFDPAAFSVEAANAALSLLQWQKVQTRRWVRNPPFDDPQRRN